MPTPGPSARRAAACAPRLAALALVLTTLPAAAQTVSLGARAPLERLPAQVGGALTLGAGPGALRLGLWHGAATETRGQLCLHVVGLPCPPLSVQDLNTTATLAYVGTSGAGAGVQVYGGPAASLRRRRIVTREADASGRPVGAEQQWVSGAGALAGVRVPLGRGLHVLGELDVAAERREVTWYEPGAGMQQGRRWEPTAHLTLGVAYQR